MLQHENPNITILNKHLWAVRFSLIPMIPQISWNPGDLDIDKMAFNIAPGGLMLLNKDFSRYPLVKTAFLAVMKLKPRQIQKELIAFPADKLSSTKAVVYRACLLAEQERRKEIKKGGAA